MLQRYTIRLVSSKLWLKPFFHRNIPAISVAFDVAARKFELTKTSRESLLAAYDCWLAHPTSSYTPPGASLNFAGPGCL